MANHTVTVTALYYYPVKSLQGIAVDEATITPQGLQHDRQWMVVDADSRVVTQRQLPGMALLRAAITDNGLILTNADDANIEVHNAQLSQEPTEVFLFRDSCSGYSAPAEINHWLATTLGSDTPLRLVKFATDQERNTVHSERFAGHTPYFADASPFLVVNTASLEALNTHLSQNNQTQISINHFRPNIVLSGIDAFAEHRFLKLKNDTFEFTLVDHSSRCSVITVNPATGKFLPKGYPLKALMRVNTLPHKPTKPAFGVNSVLIHGSGNILTIGDRFSVE